LQVVTFGDSDRLEVGGRVLAVGDPFGVDHTVTTGVVSAEGRQIGAGPYGNFIQSDASSKPGNSGGPLLNVRGEVVGINTAIFSNSSAMGGGAGNIGIGFAIPINTVRDVLPGLRSGKITRGRIGVSVTAISPEEIEALNLKDR